MTTEDNTEEEKGGIICVPGENEEEVYLYSILTEDFISENGLLNIAVVGRFLKNTQTAEGNPMVDVESFESNPEFVHFFHEMLDSLGRYSDIALEQLPKHKEGDWVYLIDQRVKDMNSAIDPKDIIGGYKVEDGKLGEYAGNPGHVLLTDDGIFQVGVKLKSELINLIKSKYNPN